MDDAGIPKLTRRSHKYQEIEAKHMPTLIEWTAVLSAIAGISASVFIVLQLWHMDKHRDLEISMKLFDWAETESLRKALRWVDREFRFENLEKYKSEVGDNFEVADYLYEVEAYFEEVGFLVNKKFVDIDVIVDRLDGYILSDWKKLEPWILAIRKERGDNTFGEHFEKLYGKTIAYMRKE
jgi:hypothetical protein